jgi:hypothetical protein
LGTNRAAQIDRLDIRGAAAAVQKAGVESKTVGAEQEGKDDEPVPTAMAEGVDVSRRRNNTRPRDDGDAPERREKVGRPAEKPKAEPISEDTRMEDYKEHEASSIAAATLPARQKRPQNRIEGETNRDTAFRRRLYEGAERTLLGMGHVKTVVYRQDPDGNTTGISVFGKNFEDTKANINKMSWYSPAHKKALVKMMERSYKGKMDRDQSIEIRDNEGVKYFMVLATKKEIAQYKSREMTNYKDDELSLTAGQSSGYHEKRVEKRRASVAQDKARADAEGVANEDRQPLSIKKGINTELELKDEFSDNTTTQKQLTKWLGSKKAGDAAKARRKAARKQDPAKAKADKARAAKRDRQMGRTL